MIIRVKRNGYYLNKETKNLISNEIFRFFIIHKTERLTPRFIVNFTFSFNFINLIFIFYRSEQNSYVFIVQSLKPLDPKVLKFLNFLFTNQWGANTRELIGNL